MDRTDGTDKEIATNVFFVILISWLLWLIVPQAYHVSNQLIYLKHMHAINHFHSVVPRWFSMSARKYAKACSETQTFFKYLVPLMVKVNGKALLRNACYFLAACKNLLSRDDGLINLFYFFSEPVFILVKKALSYISTSVLNSVLANQKNNFTWDWQPFILRWNLTCSSVFQNSSPYLHIC